MNKSKYFVFLQNRVCWASEEVWVRASRVGQETRYATHHFNAEYIFNHQPFQWCHPVDSHIQALTLWNTSVSRSLKNVTCTWNAGWGCARYNESFSLSWVSRINILSPLQNHPTPLFLLSSLQVGNIKPETEITWYKDGIEIAEDDEDAHKIGIAEGVLSFNIGKVRQLQGIVGENVGWALLAATLQASAC